MKLFDRFFSKKLETTEQKLLRKITRIVTLEINAIDSLFEKYNLAARIDRANIVASDTGGFVRYPILNSDKISKIIGYEEDIAALISEMRNEDIKLKFRRPRLMLELPYPLERKTLSWEDAPSVDSLQALVGVDYTTTTVKPVIIDWSNPATSNVLVSGETGSGKTNALVAMIIALATGTSPKDVQFIILDPKFSPVIAKLGRLPHVTIVNEPDDCADAVAAVKSEVNRRKRRPDPRKLFVVAEEISEMMIEAGKSKISLIEWLKSVAQIGREQGVHLICCTQKATVTVIDTILKANLPIRVAFKVGSSRESEVATGRTDVDCVRLPGYGAGYFVRNDQVARIQSYYIDEDDLEEIIDDIIAMWAGVTPFRIRMDAVAEEANDLPANVTQEQIDMIIEEIGIDNLFGDGGVPLRSVKTQIIRLIHGSEAPTGGANNSWANSALKYIYNDASA